MEIVSILSTSYSLEKNQGSGGGVTNTIGHARTCTGFVHIISRIIGFISRLGSISRLGLVTEGWGFGFCQRSRLIIWYSRLILGISQLISGSCNFLLQLHCKRKYRHVLISGYSDSGYDGN